MAIIKKINLNGESYDIYAYSAISAYSADYAGVAKSIDGDISWSSISGLAALSGNASETGFWTPAAISANIDQAIQDNINDLGVVYHFKDTIGTLPNTADFEEGSVYNVTATINLGKTIDGDNISAFPGDNIVWTRKGWDKLASTVSLDGYATEQYVQDHILGENENFVDQHLFTATSAVVFGDITENKTTNAWQAVTDYVNGATNNLTSADKWNSVYNTVSSTSGSWTATTTAVNTSAEYWNYAYDAITAAVETSADMELADNKDKLAEVEAITAYVAGKIAKSETSGVNIHYYGDDESLHIFTQYDGTHPANNNDK